MLQSIVNFRALAITLVVAGHLYDVVGVTRAEISGMLPANMVTGATALFVFVSGFMFQQVFAARWDYRRFMLGKIRNVLIPYLMLATPFTIYFLSRNPDFANGLFRPEDGDSFSVHVWPYLVCLLAGRVFQAYWYIPFVMLLFTLSPFHMRFSRLSLGAQIAVLAPLASLALFAHRPVENMNPVHSLISFSPIYLIGVMAAQNRESLLALARGRELLLALGVLTFAVLQSWIGHVGNHHKALFAWDGLDWMLMQKTAFALVLFILLERASHLRLRAVDRVAATSFAIFFLHPIAIIALERLALFPVIGLAWLDLALATMLVICVCVALALAAKTVAPRWSRYVIGY